MACHGAPHLEFGLSARVKTYLRGNLGTRPISVGELLPINDKIHVHHYLHQYDRLREAPLG